MAHNRPKQSNGSKKRTQDKHQNAERQKLNAEKRLANPNWVGRGKNTNNNGRR